MEISNEENESLVQNTVNRVWNLRNSLFKRIRLKEWEQIVYDVDYLLMEVNSGASFEQYFRWASVKEINRIIAALQKVGLDEIAELTQTAIRIAFPDQIPTTDEQKSKLTDWSDQQETKLEELFKKFEESNGRIINRLADFIRESGG